LIPASRQTTREGVWVIERFDDASGARHSCARASHRPAKHLEVRKLSPASLQGKLALLSSRFESLCERSSIMGNPWDGVKQRMRNYNQGFLGWPGRAQAGELLGVPLHEHAERCTRPADPRCPALDRGFGRESARDSVCDIGAHVKPDA